MPTPVLESITQEIVDRLKTVTRSNGYAYDLEVERPSPALGSRVRDNLAVVVQGTPTLEEGPQNYTQWLQPYSIVCTVIESDTSETPIDRRLNLIRADVEKALTFDRDSATRDGWAIDTELDSPDLAPLEEGMTRRVVTVNLNVRYRTDMNNPYASPFRST